jgi:hypothetical protein
MPLTREQLKTLAIELAAMTPPPDPEDAAEHTLLHFYRRNDEDGLREIDRYVRELAARRVAAGLQL